MAKKRKRTRATLDPEFWKGFDERTRRLLERIEYHRRKAAEERAARDEPQAEATS